MTSTTHFRRHDEPSVSLLVPGSRRWTGAVIGLLIGLAAVCHGCHGGDRDDELSLTGAKPRVERRREESPPTKPDTNPKR